MSLDNNNKKVDDNALANMVLRGLTKLQDDDFHATYGLDKSHLQLLLPLPDINDRSAPLHIFLRAVSELEEPHEICEGYVNQSNTKKKLNRKRWAELVRRREEWTGLITAFIQGNEEHGSVLKVSSLDKEDDVKDVTLAMRDSSNMGVSVINGECGVEKSSPESVEDKKTGMTVTTEVTNAFPFESTATPVMVDTQQQHVEADTMMPVNRPEKRKSSKVKHLPPTPKNAAKPRECDKQVEATAENVEPDKKTAKKPEKRKRSNVNDMPWTSKRAKPRQIVEEVETRTQSKNADNNAETEEKKDNILEPLSNEVKECLHQVGFVGKRNIPTAAAREVIEQVRIVQDMDESKKGGTKRTTSIDNDCLLWDSSRSPLNNLNSVGNEETVMTVTNKVTYVLSVESTKTISERQSVIVDPQQQHVEADKRSVRKRKKSKSAKENDLPSTTKKGKPSQREGKVEATAKNECVDALAESEEKKKVILKAPPDKIKECSHQVGFLGKTNIHSTTGTEITEPLHTLQQDIDEVKKARVNTNITSEKDRSILDSSCLPFTLKKAPHTSGSTTPIQPSITAEVPPSIQPNKCFSLRNWVSKLIGVASNTSPTRHAGVPSNVVSNKTTAKKLPNWMTISPTRIPPTGTARAFGYEFFTQAAGLFPSDIVNVESIALELEEANYCFAVKSTSLAEQADKEDETSSEETDQQNAVWRKPYWKRLHRVIGAICGKYDRGGLYPLILRGDYASAKEVVELPESSLMRAFDNEPF